MEAQILNVEGRSTGTDIFPQELFVRQVADVSLSAPQVLVEQRESPQPEVPAPLFVP